MDDKELETITIKLSIKLISRNQSINRSIDHRGEGWTNTFIELIFIF